MASQAALASSPQAEGLHTRLRRTPPVWCQGPELPAKCDAGGAEQDFLRGGVGCCSAGSQEQGLATLAGELRPGCKLRALLDLEGRHWQARLQEGSSPTQSAAETAEA